MAAADGTLSQEEARVPRQHHSQFLAALRHLIAQPVSLTLWKVDPMGDSKYGHGREERKCGAQSPLHLQQKVSEAISLERRMQWIYKEYHLAQALVMYLVVARGNMGLDKAKTSLEDIPLFVEMLWSSQEQQRASQ